MRVLFFSVCVFQLLVCVWFSFFYYTCVLVFAVRVFLVFTVCVFGCLLCVCLAACVFLLCVCVLLCV